MTPGSTGITRATEEAARRSAHEWLPDAMVALAVALASQAYLACALLR